MENQPLSHLYQELTSYILTECSGRLMSTNDQDLTNNQCQLELQKAPKLNKFEKFTNQTLTCELTFPSFQLLSSTGGENQNKIYKEQELIAEGQLSQSLKVLLHIASIKDEIPCAQKVDNFGANRTSLDDRLLKLASPESDKSLSLSDLPLLVISENLAHSTKLLLESRIRAYVTVLVRHFYQICTLNAKDDTLAQAITLKALVSLRENIQVISCDTAFKLNDEQITKHEESDSSCFPISFRSTVSLVAPLFSEEIFTISLSSQGGIAVIANSLNDNHISVVMELNTHELLQKMLKEARRVAELMIHQVCCALSYIKITPNSPRPLAEKCSEGKCNGGLGTPDLSSENSPFSSMEDVTLPPAATTTKDKSDDHDSHVDIIDNVMEAWESISPPPSKRVRFS